MDCLGGIEQETLAEEARTDEDLLLVGLAWPDLHPIAADGSKEPKQAGVALGDRRYGRRKTLRGYRHGADRHEEVNRRVNEAVPSTPNQKAGRRAFNRLATGHAPLFGWRSIS